jgi:dolichol kinase
MMESERSIGSHKTIAERQKAELLRKAFHFLIALVPALASFNKMFTLALLAAGTLAYAVMEYFRRKGIAIPLVSRLTEAASRRRDMGRFVLGPVTLGAGAFLTLLIFPLPAASIAVYALAFGDGTASLAGKFFGRIRPPFLLGKSVEGSAACFLGVFISAWLYTVYTGAGNFPVALAAALTATVTEVIPLRDWDNIIIPLATGLAVWLVF